MPIASTSLGFKGGIDRSAIPLRADPGTFYNLHHLRHSLSDFGRIEQIPYCLKFALCTQGTYWDGAAGATEPASSAVRLYTADAIVTDYVVRNATAQLQVFYQTTAPVATTVYTGLRLVVNSVAGLAITLGSTLDVEMTGAATFRWRKNGGAWTAGLAPLTTGVSIDAGNATLYFLANGGFAGTEAWAWTRTDRSTSGTGTGSRPCQFRYHKRVLYFTSIDERLMCVQNAGGTQYCISVGYRPIYCSYFVFYYNFLVTAGYSETVSSLYSRGGLIAWSDVNDVHNFVATDVNEADSYQLPNTNKYDTGSPYTSTSWVVGIGVVKQQLFVFTNHEAYTTSYLGLPLVFSFVKYCDVNLQGSSTASTQAVIDTPYGLVLLGNIDIYLFDGVQLQPIGTGVMRDLPLMYTGAYFKYADELVLVTIGPPQMAYIYQFRWKTWYTRSVAFDANYPTCLRIDQQFGVRYGLSSLSATSEEYIWASSVSYDTTNGTAFATPRFTTQLIGGNLRTVKELTGVYLGASVVTGVDPTYFSTGANLQAKVHWYLSTSGLIAGTPSTDTNAVWVNSNPDGWIPLPRVAFRAVALEIQLNGLSGSLPPGQAILASLEPMVYAVGEVTR